MELQAPLQPLATACSQAHFLPHPLSFCPLPLLLLLLQEGGPRRPRPPRPQQRPAGSRQAPPPRLSLQVLLLPPHPHPHACLPLLPAFPAVLPCLATGGSALEHSAELPPYLGIALCGRRSHSGRSRSRSVTRSPSRQRARSEPGAGVRSPAPAAGAAAVPSPAVAAANGVAEPGSAGGVVPVGAVKPPPSAEAVKKELLRLRKQEQELGARVRSLQGGWTWADDWPCYFCLPAVCQLLCLCSCKSTLPLQACPPSCRLVCLQMTWRGAIASWRSTTATWQMLSSACRRRSRS